METVIDFISKLFLAESWPARWQCGIWSSFHGWLYIGSSLAIWAAYFAIPFILAYFLYKRKDVPFSKVIWLFVAFIFACGATHFIDAMLFYYPAYRFSATVLLICAVVSWATVVALFKVIPKVLKFKSPDQLTNIINLKTNNLQLATNRLKRQNNQLLSFAHITSHDLRGPITNLITLVEMYKDEADQQRKEDYVNLLKSESQALLNTMDDLNEALKVRSSEGIESEPISFQAITKEVISSISTLVAQSKAIIHQDFDSLPVINYPKVYLHSILINLISNAIKYKHPNRSPEIWLRSFEIGNQQILTCSDNGIGLDMVKYGKKVFNLHKKFHGNSDARGVGLFLTKSQIESMGGSIKMESAVNKGSKFIVIFNDETTH